MVSFDPMTKARALLSIAFPSPFVIILIILCCLPVLWQGCGRGSRPDELVIMIEKRVYFDPRNESDSAAERMRQLIAFAATHGLSPQRVTADVLTRKANGGVHQGVVAGGVAVENIRAFFNEEGYLPGIA